MAVMDEFKEERNQIKKASLKEKLKYFWYYYKWHTFAVIAVISIIGFGIYGNAHQKETVFFAALLNNAAAKEERTLEQEFTDYAGIDAEKYRALLDDTMTIDPNGTDEMSVSSSQRMLIYISATELDVILGGEDVFPGYAYNDIFYDLRDILSEEQAASYEPYFYYADRSVMKILAEARENMVASNITELPDPTKPELMEDPVPIGIFVSDSIKLNENYFFKGIPAVGILVNAPHPEISLQFIDFLMQ